MEVILLKSLDNLGELGEVVTVARGYARNYLLPQGLAVEASEGAKKMVADKVRLELKRDHKRQEAAEALARELVAKKVAVTIPAQAGEEDQLYGSVSVKDIVAACAGQNLELEEKQVRLEEPIKQLGDYEVPVKLHREVEITVRVHVIRAE